MPLTPESDTRTSAHLNADDTRILHRITGHTTCTTAAAVRTRQTSPRMPTPMPPSRSPLLGGSLSHLRLATLPALASSAMPQLHRTVKLRTHTHEVAVCRPSRTHEHIITQLRREGGPIRRHPLAPLTLPAGGWPYSAHTARTLHPAPDTRDNTISPHLPHTSRIANNTKQAHPGKARDTAPWVARGLL